MDNTQLERRLLGVLTFVVCAVPVAVIGGMGVAFAFKITSPPWLDTVAVVAFIVAAGLQFPLFLICGAYAGAKVAAPDGGIARPRFQHPFSLFVFWWRNVRS